jgi:hypothetical protein
MTGVPAMISRLEAAPDSDALVLTRDEQKASDQARRGAVASHVSGRRRNIDPATCERDYSAAEMDFMKAMQEYKRTSGRMFPTWSEVLEVVHGLGYRKAQG